MAVAISGARPCQTAYSEGSRAALPGLYIGFRHASLLQALQREILHLAGCHQSNQHASISPRTAGLPGLVSLVRICSACELVQVVDEVEKECRVMDHL